MQYFGFISLMFLLCCYYRKKFIENNFADEGCRTYENLDALRMQADNTDSASLHFESILEGDIGRSNGGGGGNAGDSTIYSSDMSAAAGTSTGSTTAAGIDHFIFDMQRDNYDIPRNDPSASSIERSYENTDLDVDMERKKREFSYKYTNYGQAKNELTDNALFNKFRDAADGCAIVSPSSADLSTTNHDHVDEDDDDDVIDTNDDEQLSEGKLKGSNSNSVSCEDLLEFANKKPKGKERGIESDEVRIMTKVLGTNVSNHRSD